MLTTIPILAIPLYYFPTCHLIIWHLSLQLKFYFINISIAINHRFISPLLFSLFHYSHLLLLDDLPIQTICQGSPN